MEIVLFLILIAIYAAWIHGLITYDYKEVEEEKKTMKPYVIKKGDTLSGIAKKFLGDASRYPEIMEVNGLTSTTIHTGVTIFIPDGTETAAPNEYEKIGKQFVKCLEDIENLESVKQLEKMLTEV